jgi:hypothetical protein
VAAAFLGLPGLARQLRGGLLCLVVGADEEHGRIVSSMRMSLRRRARAQAARCSP